jgi:hypothetical protein
MEKFQMLQTVYAEQKTSHSQRYEWHHRSKHGRESPVQLRLTTEQNDYNMRKVQEDVSSDHYQMIQKTEEKL